MAKTAGAHMFYIKYCLSFDSLNEYMHKDLLVFLS